MSVTQYSLFVAVLWSAVYLLIGTMLRRKSTFILRVGILPVFLVLLCSMLRIVFAFELRGVTRVIRSESILPRLRDFFLFPVFADHHGNVMITIGGALLVLWIFVGLGMLLYALFQYHGEMGNIRRRGCAPSEREKSVLEEVLAEHKVFPRAYLVTLDYINAPMSTGFFKPKMFLPAIEYTDRELYYIYTHEITHYKNRDSWYKLCVLLVRSAFWWLPLTSWLQKDMNQILEIKCDCAVIKNGDEHNRIEYLENVLSVGKKCKQARGKQAPIALTSRLLGSESSVDIEQRFDIALDYLNNSKKRRLLSALFQGVLLLSFALSFVFVPQPYTPPPSEVYEGALSHGVLDSLDKVALYDESGDRVILIPIQTFYEKYGSLPLYNEGGAVVFEEEMKGEKQ